MNIKAWPLVSRFFSTSSYPYAPGSQNRDGFERNHDNPLRWSFDEGTLMRLSAVTRCVKLLSETIAALPVDVYERGNGPGQKRVATEFWAYPLLCDSPNDEITSQAYWEMILGSLLLNGKAYVEKRKGTQGTVVRLDPLVYNEVGGTRDRGYSYRGRTIAAADMLVYMGFTLNGDPMSAVQYGANVFSSALSSDSAARNTFKNGLMPTVAFGMKEVLKQAQRTEFRENFRSELAGAMNAGKPPLLEGGMTAFPIGINPKDAQLLESRGFSIEEICRWFGVPPFMVGHASQGQTNWGTGIEQQMLGFLSFSLLQWIIRLEKQTALSLLSPVERKKFYVKFNPTGLLRTDSAGRAALYTSALQNGWMCRNEVRALEDLPPVEGGDIYTAQSNLLPLDQLGQEANTAQSQQVAAVVKQWLGIPEER